MHLVDYILFSTLACVHVHTVPRGKRKQSNRRNVTGKYSNPVKTIYDIACINIISVKSFC